MTITLTDSSPSTPPSFSASLAKATQPSSPLISAPLPPLVPIPQRQPSPSFFKSPSLPSSRSYPSLLSLSSSPSPSFRPLQHSPLPSSSQSHLRRVNSDLCRLGHLAFSRSDYDEAISHYTAALELSMDDPRTWNNRATCYVAKRMYRMGIRDYHEAISRAPRHAEFYYKRGVAWSALKQYAYAIEDYSKCLELNADYADALNNRGNAYRILNQYTLAKTDLKRAVQLAPSSDLYANNLKRVEAALQEEEKTGKSAQQTAIESILQSVLSAKLQGNHAQPILPGMSAQLESMLKSFIALKQSPSHAVPVVAPPSHSATSAFSPPPSRSSSPAPPSPSSSSSSTSSSSSPSLSSVVQSLPAPLLNTLLQLFVEYRAAQKGEGRGQKRTRDEGEGKIKVGTIKVYGEELYDEGEDEEHSPSSAASEGSRSPESGGGRGEVTEGLDISEMERCRKAIAV